MPPFVLLLGAVLLVGFLPTSAVAATADDRATVGRDGVARAFPLPGGASYGSAHHDYPATDIFAPCGARVVAPVDGVVLELSREDRWSSATNRGAQRGGKFFSIAGDDGVRYYGSHLRRVRPKVVVGMRVRAGMVIGRNGRTGSAAGTPCHLHFGLSPVCAGTRDWWTRRGVVSPYEFLRSWERDGSRSPKRAVRGWKRTHGCPQAP